MIVIAKFEQEVLNVGNYRCSSRSALASGIPCVPRLFGTDPHPAGCGINHAGDALLPRANERCLVGKSDPPEPLVVKQPQFTRVEGADIVYAIRWNRESALVR